jgi:hypothetical protein
MDLNYLLYHHQLLLVRAANPRARAAERLRAAVRAARISSLIEAWRAAHIKGRRFPLPGAGGELLSPLSSLSTGGLRFARLAKRDSFTSWPGAAGSEGREPRTEESSGRLQRRREARRPARAE